MCVYARTFNIHTKMIKWHKSHSLIKACTSYPNVTAMMVIRRPKNASNFRSPIVKMKKYRTRNGTKGPFFISLNFCCKEYYAFGDSDFDFEARIYFLLPIRHLLVQSQQCKHQLTKWNLFKVNNKEARPMSITSSLCLYC